MTLNGHYALYYITCLECWALSREFRVALPWELLYADDLVVIAETEEDLRQKVTQKAVRYPCGVCGRGVGNNSIQCTSCKKWVHRKCSGIKGSMYKVMKSFICRGCVNPVTGTGRTSVDIGGHANLELVDKFCYLGDMLSVYWCSCGGQNSNWMK